MISTKFRKKLNEKEALLRPEFVQSSVRDYELILSQLRSQHQAFKDHSYGGLKFSHILSDSVTFSSDRKQITSTSDRSATVLIQHPWELGCSNRFELRTDGSGYFKIGLFLSNSALCLTSYVARTETGVQFVDQGKEIRTMGTCNGAVYVQVYFRDVYVSISCFGYSHHFKFVPGSQFVIQLNSQYQTWTLSG
ncbi:hypothetical protein RCL1_000207 [Eukaryota sp. TZLM3-RCL]